MVMRNTLFVAAVGALVGACGYVSEYEKAVYDFEPVYCYQSIGGVECYKTPKHRDERRLVNYYGPHPSRYDRPEPTPPPTLSAPPSVDFYVRDSEPIPEPAPPRVRTKPEADEQRTAQIPEPAEDPKAEPTAGDTSEGQAAPAAKAAEAAAATPGPDDTRP